MLYSIYCILKNFVVLTNYLLELNRLEMIGQRYHVAWVELKQSEHLYFSRPMLVIVLDEALHLLEQLIVQDLYHHLYGLGRGQRARIYQKVAMHPPYQNPVRNHEHLLQLHFHFP